MTQLEVPFPLGLTAHCSHFHSDNHHLGELGGKITHCNNGNQEGGTRILDLQSFNFALKAKRITKYLDDGNRKVDKRFQSFTAKIYRR